MENGDADFTSRARGVLVGLAAGNLFGIRQEFKSREHIERRWPDGVRAIEADHGWPDDDDLAQAIVVAEAAAEGPLRLDDLARRLWRWGELNGAGMGGLTRDALAAFGGGQPQCLARDRRRGRAREPDGVSAADASREAWMGSRAGNGAVMRCAPVAVRWAGDPARLVRESIVSAAPTHWDPRCGWSCALVNLAIAGALLGEDSSGPELMERARSGVAASLEELRQFGYAAEAPASVRETVEEAAKTRLRALATDGADIGYTLLTLKACLVACREAESVEQALRAVVEGGGDTDTNGAAIGAVAGARFGLEGIPEDWRAHVAEIRDGRIPMEAYADRLVAARTNRGNEAARPPGTRARA